MKLNHHADLIAKLEELDVYTTKVIVQFPRSENWFLKAKIYESVDQLMRLTISGWKRYRKDATLGRLDEEVEAMRHYIRRAFALHYISADRYEIWSRHVDEIGRMVGGWIKSQRSR